MFARMRPPQYVVHSSTYYAMLFTIEIFAKVDDYNSVDNILTTISKQCTCTLASILHRPLYC